jgi:predicted Rossmann fold flavoprotein
MPTTYHQVIVVGAGAAGLMAAGRAAEAGAETLLLEKMERPGRKLRITGKGRCNLTNVLEMEEFIQRFGPNGIFLRQAFHQFFAPDLLDFFEELGVQTVTERGGRVFPVSEHAQDVVDALVHWVRKQGVTLRARSVVERLLVEEGRIAGVMDMRERIYHAPAVIIATGGASYPATGSTGDGYRLAESVGHTIVPIRPALVPLETAGNAAQRLQGLSLRNTAVRLRIDGKQQADAFGEMLFTHFGVSGPMILYLSKLAVDALCAGQKVELSIDLKPALDKKTLDTRLLRDIDAQGKKHFQNLLKTLLPGKLIPVCVDLVSIPAHKPAHQITSEERTRLRKWLKDFRLAVTGHRGFEEAIVTAGGVALDKIDPRTMESRLMKGLYFAGEVLDIDANTGGFNLQAAFSTGRVAGQAAAQIEKDTDSH